MIENDVGGGYGARGEFYPEDFLIPFAARHVKRPVKWIEDRRENLMAMNHAREEECDLEVACARDGTILAIRGEVHTDMGAYMRTNGAVGARNVSQFMAGPYRVPHVKIDSSLWMTNKTPVGTYRGPGRFEANFFLERMIDMIAADLGIDRIEFRRKNLIKSSEQPYPIAHVQPTDARDEYDSGEYSETLDRALQEIDWPNISKLQGKLIDGKYHGLGVVCFVEGGAAGPKEIGADRDQQGRHHVGLHGHVVGRAGRRDGVRADRRRRARGADRAHPSRLSRLDRLCERRLRRLPLALDRDGRLGGARRHQQFHGDLAPGRRQAAGLRRVQRHARHRQGDGRRPLAWRFANSPASPPRARSSTRSTPTATARTSATSRSMPGSAASRSSITSWCRTSAARSIRSPCAARCWARWCRVSAARCWRISKYDENGQFLTGSLADYLLPTATDFPNLRCVVLDNYPSPINPLGAKGAGEGGIIAAGGCMANAVANALSSFGVQPRELPLSPTYIWKLVRAGQRKVAE